VRGADKRPLSPLIIGKHCDADPLLMGRNRNVTRMGDGYEVTTTGWRPGCACADARPPVPATVLDPFSGAGTTLLVADRLQRDGIGIELNADYVAMAERRIASDAPLFVTTIPPVQDADATYDRQPGLFAAAAWGRLR
jgi:hypothetical protein